MRANYRKYEGGWTWLSWAVPAAAGLLGALTGQREAKKNRQLQEEIARSGIQMRVADAEKAGVHPVYALNAGTPTFAPVTSGAGEILAQTGQNVGRAIRDSQMQDAQMKAMDASTQRDTAAAMMYANEAARIRQAMNSGGGAYQAPPDVIVGAYDDSGSRGIESHPLYRDAVKLQPDEMVSRSGDYPGQTSGKDHPSMREFQMANGDKLLLPATGQGGIPEEIDIAMLPEIIGANLHRYGTKQAVLGALNRWFGGGRFPSQDERDWNYRKNRGPTASGRIR